jgi:hypothetical protein
MLVVSQLSNSVSNFGCPVFLFWVFPRQSISPHPMNIFLDNCKCVAKWNLPSVAANEPPRRPLIQLRYMDSSVIQKEALQKLWRKNRLNSIQQNYSSNLSENEQGKTKTDPMELSLSALTIWPDKLRLGDDSILYNRGSTCIRKLWTVRRP